MKKIIYFILPLFLISTSCQDEILSKKPLDMISDAAVWNDPSLIDAFLTMQYSLSSVMVNESKTYIESWSAGTPISTEWDIFNSEHCYGPFIINNISDEGKGGWEIVPSAGYKAGGISINGGLLEWWENNYYIVRNLNQIIEKVPNSPVDKAWAKTKTAEARFLRAFNYFAMVKRYGAVPLVTKTLRLNDSEELLYPARNSEKEIYDFIISEMSSISGDLSEIVSIGRPSKWTALALKSRAALYAGSIAKYGNVQLYGLLGIPSSLSNEYYTIAYEASDSIVKSAKFSLYNVETDKVKNFKNIFTVKNNSEVIFAKQHNYVDALGGGGATWGYDFVQRPKPHAWNIGMGNCPYLELAEEFEYIDGTKGTLDRDVLQSQLWSMDELWGNKDPRFYATIYTMGTPWKGSIVDFHKGLIAPTGETLENQQDGYGGVSAWGTQNLFGNFHTGFGVMKYLDENLPIGSTWSNSGTDYIVFRYGEIILNLAEAAFEIGKPNEALNAINEIRNRAGIQQLNSVNINKIRHERKVELAFEGHRYWDLRRWRISETELTKKFSGLRYILDYDTRKYKIVVLANVDGGVGSNFNAKNYYLPVTLKRTGENSNLVENPGY